MLEANILTVIREHMARLANRLPLVEDYAVEMKEIEDMLAALVGATERRNKGNRTMDEMVEYVNYVLDTALSPDHTRDDIGPGAMLVGWQNESEPMVVAVIGATMDTKGRRDSVDEDEAVEIATDYLDEIGWFSDGPTKPDHVARV